MLHWHDSRLIAQITIPTNSLTAQSLPYSSDTTIMLIWGKLIDNLNCLFDNPMFYHGKGLDRVYLILLMIEELGRFGIKINSIWKQVIKIHIWACWFFFTNLRVNYMRSRGWYIIVFWFYFSLPWHTWIAMMLQLLHLHDGVS